MAFKIKNSKLQPNECDYSLRKGHKNIHSKWRSDTAQNIAHQYLILQLADGKSFLCKNYIDCLKKITVIFLLELALVVVR